MSLIITLNKIGELTDHCGTPLEVDIGSEIMLLILTEILRKHAMIKKI